MKILPFILLILIALILGLATFAENRFGTPFVINHIYGSWWMITLWAALVLTALSLSFQKLLKSRRPAFLLHISFAVILIGALLTFTISESGQIHLREDGMNQSDIEIPFEISLKKFEIENYKGTTTPSDYISHLTIKDEDDSFDATISMNNIFKYRGYRFYQASYDNDLRGSVISVSYDPFGIYTTYLGYFLMFVSMIWLLFDKNGRFRKLIRTLSVIAMLVIPTVSQAQRTLTKEEAKAFGNISMYYNGRIVPVDTYAHDFTLKITGNTSYKSFNYVQILAGWIFFPEDWYEEPMIKIKDKNVRKMILPDNSKTDKLRLSDFYNAGIYKLKYLNLPKNQKGVREIDEKVGLLMAQGSGSALTIFPQKHIWLSLTDDLSGVNSEDTLFVSKFFYMLSETVEKGNPDAAINLFNKLSVYQEKRAEQGAISSKKTAVEIFYNKFNVSGILFKINLTFGIIAFVLFIFGILRNRKFEWPDLIIKLQIIIALILVTAWLILRWYVSGHIPMSNGYETMMFVAWSILLISLLLRKNMKILPASGLLLSGFVLLVASLGSMNPQITKLVPVLMSPWLSIHVSLIMISYALLGLILFNGLAAIIIHFSVKDNTSHLIKLQTISRIILYPALFTLTAGIFIGAIWANVSWGRYWGWDPKEVWALITMLVYSLAMHGETLPVFRRPLFYHIFLTLSFLTVIMTYFGVSLFFGGMHSYN
jgi:cytochrome c-type biogenesis protein CcsB